MVSNALLKAKYGSYAIGEERLFAFAPSDPRWIVRDGSVIAKADYPALYEVYYCGDALNATAGFGYRCTDPLNPSTTRDIAGLYVVLENADGRFDRAIVPGGSRAMWSYEADQMQGHFHDYRPDGQFTSNLTGIGGASGYAAGGFAVSSDMKTRGASGDGVNGVPRTGAETRPKNTAKWPGIFAGIAA